MKILLLTLLIFLFGGLAFGQTQNCNVNIFPNSITMPASGGTAYANFTEDIFNCSFPIVNNNSWISATISRFSAPAVIFTVEANTGAARTGTITIADKIFTVYQTGAGCTYSLSAQTLSFPAGGGNTGFNVTASSGCPINASSDVDWLKIDGASGSGSGTITFSVSPNYYTFARTATISVFGEILTVDQSAGQCEHSLSETNKTVLSTGGQYSLNVIASGSQCANWSAVSNVPWVTINNGNGTGNGVVTFTVSEGNGVERKGRILVAGQTLFITQITPCTFTVLPEGTRRITKNATTLTYSVTASNSECAWTTGFSSEFFEVPWITVNTPTGKGSGTASFSVTENKSPERSTWLTIAGMSSRVSQQTGCLNSYPATPSSEDFTKNGGYGSFLINAPISGCWNTNVEFNAGDDYFLLNVTKVPEGDNTRIYYYVSANFGAARFQKISIRSFEFPGPINYLTVNQAEGCNYNLSRENVTLPSSGGTFAFRVTPSNSNCPLFVDNNAPNWTTNLSVNAGLVTFTVAPNTGAARNQTLVIRGADPANGQGFRIFQDAASIRGKTVGVFRPSNGITYLRNSNTAGFADVNMVYGVAGDQSIAGDWNGDRIDSIGIYRNGTFYLRNSNTTGAADIVFAFGAPGDQPIAGDWNGDGIDTIGVYRPTTGMFMLRNSNSAGAPDVTFVLGNPGDVAIAGDWNGDGITTTGVFRPTNGIVYLKNANTTGDADIYLVYGVAGDKPVAGDWDGNGQDSIGIYRDGVFYLRNSNTQGFADIVFALGNPGDEPIAGDWDGLP